MDFGRSAKETSPLIDRFGRHITYLRLSVTDRCDLRCTYCMSENMTFLPKKEVLTLEELTRISDAFIDRGVRKIRVTGGEPLVRKDILQLFRNLGQRLGDGLDELTLTTNATLLQSYAADLFEAGVRRINVSLDSLDETEFQRVTRGGDLSKVVRGIHAALDVGMKIKINTVALKGTNTQELDRMIRWAHGLGMDMTLIEVMPLGETGEDRFDQYVPLTAIRSQLEETWTLTDIADTIPNSGPARYVRIEDTGGKLGFITPLTNNFCAGCNRVRVTCTGRIYMCLGQDDHIDLRACLREAADPETALNEALETALFRKPEKHDFEIEAPEAAPALPRHMSMTGG